MRNNLQFKPIEFQSIQINGLLGVKDPRNYFRSSLLQNICYCVRKDAKSIDEIADNLGVSPIYVETEAERLERYGFLLFHEDKYLANFVINEPTTQIIKLQHNMYKKAADLFANDLWDELVFSGILDDKDIICEQFDIQSKKLSPLYCDRSVTRRDEKYTNSTQKRHNFLLWNLIPYIACESGKNSFAKRLSFNEVADYRPDDGQYLVSATVMPEFTVFPNDFVYMNDWLGPIGCYDNNKLIWRFEGKWSDKYEREHVTIDEANRVLSLYCEKDKLSKQDYAWLSKHGYVNIYKRPNRMDEYLWQITVLQTISVHNRLIEIGDKIKAKYKKNFDSLKRPYIKAVLESTPLHLRKYKEYEFQFLFRSDGCFLSHCISCLLNNGKLKEPSIFERKTIMTLIATI